MATTNTSGSGSGVAGRTDYSTWSRRASDLTQQLDVEDELEKSSADAACGLDGKHAFSQSEAEEREKAKQARQAKKALDAYKKREWGVVQNLTGLLGELKSNEEELEVAHVQNAQGGGGKKGGAGIVKYVTRDMIDAGKRVVSICDTSGPGKIVLTQDLSNLESEVPTTPSSSSNDASIKLQPKSYQDDAENNPVVDTTQEEQLDLGEKNKRRVARGIIKLIIRNLHRCTVIIKCKIITGTVEISHCTDITVIAEGEDANVVTIQADVCTNLDIQFRDSPSGKNVRGSSTLYWGQDEADRVYHAGVSNMRIATYRDGYVDLETTGIDYLASGAKAVGNASAEEVQFVTSIVDGEFATEKVLSVSETRGLKGALPLTERELKVLEKKKEKIQNALDEKLKDVIQIKDSSSSLPPPSPPQPRDDGNSSNKKTESTPCNTSDEVIDEIYASATKEEVDAITMSVNDEKAKGNAAFAAGEYAQAILFYTMALDRAAELPDATSVNEWLTTTTDTNSTTKATQLYDRHIILSNRSACFLKLGHHDKALNDSTDAEKLDPTYVKALFRKGLALHAMGRYDEAIKSLSSAHRIEPKNGQIKQALQFAEVRMTQEMRKRMQG